MAKNRLPLAFSWSTGQNGDPGLTPQWQADQIAAGRRMAPHIELFVSPRTWDSYKDYALPGVVEARKQNLPLCLVSDNVFYRAKVWPSFAGISFDPNAPDEHPWVVLDQDTGPNTVTTHFSMWSELTPRYCYLLGHDYGSSEMVRGIAAEYPHPPLVVLFDNHEVGTRWKFDVPDVRETRYFAKLREYIASMEPQPERTFEQTPEYQIANAWFLYQKTAQAGYMKLAMHREFNRGFADAIKEHAPGWSDVHGWSGYQATGNPDWGGGTTDFMYNDGFEIKSWTANLQYPWTRNGVDFDTWLHRYGPTGQAYLQSWYRGWDRVRAWGQMSTQRYAQDMLELLFGRRQVRLMLSWEGNDIARIAKPDREHWRGFARMALWMSGAELMGHFANSTTSRDSEAATVYYDEVIKACEEVHNLCKLSEYWQEGEIVVGDEPNPFQRQNEKQPAYRDDPWYFLRIEEAGRYDENGVDLWMQDRTNSSVPIHAAAIAYRRDGKYLLYVCGVVDPVEATVTIPGHGQVVVHAPVGGAFYEVDGNQIERVA